MYLEIFLTKKQTINIVTSLRVIQISWKRERVHVVVFNPIHTGLFFTSQDRGGGGGASGGPTPVTLQPLIV